MVHPNGFQDFPCFLEEYSIPNSFMKLPVSTESFFERHISRHNIIDVASSLQANFLKG